MRPILWKSHGYENQSIIGKREGGIDVGNTRPIFKFL